MALSGRLRCDLIPLAGTIRAQELRVMNNFTRERRSSLGCFPGQPTPGLYDRALEVFRARHFSRRAEEAYVHCIRRFTFFHADAHPRKLREGHVNTFLGHLAVKENVAASTQNQTLAALLFLYGPVLELNRGGRGLRSPLGRLRKAVGRHSGSIIRPDRGRFYARQPKQDLCRSSCRL
jgi:hypothetical protein